MGSAFNVGFQQANDAMLQRRAEADAQKNQQRAQTAALYWNAVQTPLPPATVKDAQGNQITNPAYADAEQKREGLIKDYLGYLGPEQHATIGNRLHALIFGPEHQEMQQSAQAAAPPPAAAAAPPQSTHPMTSNPQYTKIQEGLDALSKRLKGFAHPLASQPEPDIALMAGAQQPEERKSADLDRIAEQKQQDALALVDERNKGRAPSAAQEKLDAAARSEGFDDFKSTPPEKQLEVIQKAGAAGRAPQKPIIERDPKTGLFLALSTGPDGQIVAKSVVDVNGNPVGGFKPETVSRRSGFYYYTDSNNQVHQVPTTTETDTIFGPTADRNAKGKPPVSSQAPTLATVNAKIQANPGKAGASSRKEARKAPTSSQSPNLGRVIGQKESPLQKADIQQYIKIAEDANTKAEAYSSAASAAKAPTPTTDQELIYSWVRSNVQGAGRMTQAEFKQAGGVGSVPLRVENWVSLASTGKMTPRLRAFMLADIKRASDTAQAKATEIRGRIGGPVSTQAPQLTTPPAGGVDWSKFPQ